jgi:hypothetical protein
MLVSIVTTILSAEIMSNIPFLTNYSECRNTVYYLKTIVPFAIHDECLIQLDTEKNTR